MTADYDSHCQALDMEHFWRAEAMLDSANRIQLINEAVNSGLFGWREARRMISIQDRLTSYASTGFPEALFCSADGRIVGTWIMGNNYRVKSSYYGGYPPTYLKRIKALFPDRWRVLHLFSGKVDTEEMPGDTVDINPDNNPTWVDDAQTLLNVPLENYDLVMADPPYSVEDAERYQTSMIKRNLVMQVLGNRLKPGAVVVWLDQVLPIYRKDQFDWIGAIGMYKSTNHRIRGVTIFQKNILTEKQKCINLSSRTRATGNTNQPQNTESEMNTKLLSLLFTIAATAFTQMANACSKNGGDAPAAGGNKKGKPEPEEDTTGGGDDDDDILGSGTTLGGEAAPDPETIRKEATALVNKLFAKSEDNKPKIKAIITKQFGGTRLGDMDGEQLPKFLEALKKIK